MARYEIQYEIQDLKEDFDDIQEDMGDMQNLIDSARDTDSEFEFERNLVELERYLRATRGRVKEMLEVARIRRNRAERDAAAIEEAENTED